MTKVRYISDARIVFALAGLRWVARRDEKYDTYPERYYLDIQYKGCEKSIQYGTKDERDSTYEAARLALEDSHDNACDDLGVGDGRMSVGRDSHVSADRERVG